MIRAALLVFALVFFDVSSGCCVPFEWSERCGHAYRLYMALDPDAAAEQLAAENRVRPGNPAIAYLADYGDCLELLFNGDRKRYESRKGLLEERLKVVETISDTSPWQRFCKANLYLHWAIVAARFGDNFKAATRFRRSFLLLQENRKLFPDFEENKVLLGLEQAVAGAIPDNYRWIGSVFGVRGDVRKGVAAIVAYLNAHPDGQSAMYDEAAIYYAYLKFYLLAQQDLAWQFVNGKTFTTEHNLMRRFVKANLALNYRKADIALGLLRPVTAAAPRYPVLDYEMGEALLLRLDFSAASYFQRFLDRYAGQPFVKDAWQKISWIAYLQQKDERMHYALKQVQDKGDQATDADKQAYRFAAQPAWPLRELLKVRLLIDGGYYGTAEEQIRQINREQLSELPARLEYHFRYGRIFEEENKGDKAIAFYQAVIRDGRNRKEYFAARAALQTAFIQERAGNKTAAITAFRDCLSMKGHDFQTSIDQQAKAGLNRLGAE